MDQQHQVEHGPRLASGIAAPRELFTVKQFCARRPAWTQPSMRNMILNAADRIGSRGQLIKGNGLADAGAIIRVGRRVLIDEEAFFRWIAEQQKRQRKKAP